MNSAPARFQIVAHLCLLLAIVLLTPAAIAQPTLTGGELTSGTPYRFTLGPITATKLYGNWSISVPANVAQLRVELALATPGVTMDIYTSAQPVILQLLSGGFASVTTRCPQSARPTATAPAVVIVTPTSTVCGMGFRNIAIIMYTQNVTAEVTVTATVIASGPALNSGGITNGASFAAGNVAAGSIVSVFGTGLTPSAQAASSVPLPKTLGGTSFTLGGQAVPLFFVSPLQANLQIPWELAGQSQASLTVTAGSVTSSATTVNLTAVTPGIFTIDQSGKGQGAILNASSGEFAAPTGSIPGQSTRPAARGAFVSIYCTGLGAVTNQPASGAVSPSNPVATTTVTPTVTIGGVPATVSFSGLAPGFVGLYQVNVQVPETAPTGSAVAVVLTSGGASSNSVTIAVQQ